MFAAILKVHCVVKVLLVVLVQSAKLGHIAPRYQFRGVAGLLLTSITSCDSVVIDIEHVTVAYVP